MQKLRVSLMILVLLTITGCRRNNVAQEELNKLSLKTISSLEDSRQQSRGPYISDNQQKKEANQLSLKKVVVVIDPGHQTNQNVELEPIGPGAKETKKKVSSGTYGSKTGVAEYKLNLIVAEKLQTELKRLGYTVIMTRTKHNVDISNAQRAKIANRANASLFIRIHANGNENPTENGVMTICNTSQNPYNAKIYNQSRKLSEDILNEMLKTTKAQSKGVWETDSMTGINWSKVPTTIVEIGYMSNPIEDTLLATEEYQDKIVAGIRNGIDKYIQDINH